MRFQILHCASVSFRDEEPATRPKGIIAKPADDIDLDLHAEDLGSRVPDSLKLLLKAFEIIDLANTYDSPIQIDEEYLRTLLQTGELGIKRALTDARKRKLLTHLQIKKDYGAWVERSDQKGFLVLMTSVEQKDFDREDLAKKYVDEVSGLRDQLVSEGHHISKVVLVPNAHLTDRDSLETDSERACKVVNRLYKALCKRGYDVQEASFGFGKRVGLEILGHPRSFTFHKL